MLALIYPGRYKRPIYDTIKKALKEIKEGRLPDFASLNPELDKELVQLNNILPLKEHVNVEYLYTKIKKLNQNFTTNQYTNYPYRGIEHCHLKDLFILENIPGYKHDLPLNAWIMLESDSFTFQSDDSLLLNNAMNVYCRILIYYIIIKNNYSSLNENEKQITSDFINIFSPLFLMNIDSFLECFLNTTFINYISKSVLYDNAEFDKNFTNKYTFYQKLTYYPEIIKNKYTKKDQIKITDEDKDPKICSYKDKHCVFEAIRDVRNQLHHYSEYFVPGVDFSSRNKDKIEIWNRADRWIKIIRIALKKYLEVAKKFWVDSTRQIDGPDYLCSLDKKQLIVRALRDIKKEKAFDLEHVDLIDDSIKTISMLY